MKRERFVIGNWKMNLDSVEAKTLFDTLNGTEIASSEKHLVIAPPIVYLAAFSANLEGGLELAAQNVYSQENGAYTGEISASMLASLGVSYSLVGHSERRDLFGEDEVLLAKKVSMLISRGVRPVYCCGETLEERNQNAHLKVLKAQIEGGLFHLSEADFRSVIVAYEPVWAIGTGITATSAQAEEMHAFIRHLIAEKYGNSTAEITSILYGGSCNADNAPELFSCPNIDGGLIGGASLTSNSFLRIAHAL